MRAYCTNEQCAHFMQCVHEQVKFCRGCGNAVATPVIEPVRWPFSVAMAAASLFVIGAAVMAWRG